MSSVRFAMSSYRVYLEGLVLTVSSVDEIKGGLPC
jgi:hypothetical protein